MKLRILCVVLLCAFASSASAEPPLSERVPAQWAFYLGWSGRTMPFEGSLLGQLLNEPALSGVFDTIHQAAVDGLRSGAEQQAFENAWELGAIAWQHPVALTADTLVRNDKQLWRAALLIDVGRDKPQFAEHLDALVEALGDELPFEQASAAGVTFRTVAIAPETQLSFGFMDELFFAYVGPDGPRELIELDADSALASDESFQQRMAAVNGEDIQVAFHVDLNAFTERLGPAWREQTGIELEKLLTAAGLDRVSAVAGTTRILDRGMYTKSRIFSPAEHKGLLSLLAGKKLSSDDLAGVPADADYVWAGNISAEDAYVELQRCLEEYDPHSAEEFAGAVEELENQTELSLRTDVFAPFGETWVVTSAPSYGGFLSGTVLTVELDDAERFAGTVQHLEDQLRSVLENSGGGLLTTPAERAEISYLTMAQRDFVLPLAPAWAVGEDRVYIAGWPQVIKAAMLGTAQRPLTESSEYRSAREKIQGEPNILSYLNTPKVARQTYQWWLLGWTTGANALSGQAGIQARPDWLPALPTLQKYLRPQISAVSADEEGITFESYGSLPGLGLISSSLASPLVPAAALPALSKARADARRVVSQTNLNGIGKAIHMYSSNNRDKLPPNLGALVEEGYIAVSAQPGQKSILTSPLGNRMPAFEDGKIVGECDYIYTQPGVRLGEIPSHSDFVLVYERPENYDGRGTHVVFVDGHVEWMDIEEFEQALGHTEEVLEQIRDRREDF